MKRCDKLFILLLTLLLIFAWVPVHSLANKEHATIKTKDEVVYGTLDANGKSEAAYVVNVFEVAKRGQLTDYGAYREVKNLTNIEELIKDNTKVTFPVEEGKFYYQGNLDEINLPWHIEVNYYLDGEVIDPISLLGQDGRVTIEIKTEPNEAVDRLFFEHYTLQITIPFDGEKVSNLEAPDATVAKAGKTEQITYAVLPEESAHVEVTAEVVDFELEGIELVGIPFIMAIDDPDTDEMVEEMGMLSNAIDNIHEGIGQLDDGLRDINSGTDDLVDGSAQFKQGLLSIHEASTPLVKGSQQMNDTFQLIQEELSFVERLDFPPFEKLIKSLEDIKEALDEMAEGLEGVANEYKKAYEAIDDVVTSLPERDEDLELSQEDIETMRTAGIAEEKINYMMQHYEAAQALKTIFRDESKVSSFAELEETIRQSSDHLYELSHSVAKLKDGIIEGSDDIRELESLEELVIGMEQMITMYGSFHEGLVSYTDGVAALTNTYADVHGGMGELATGTNALASGTRELYEGTNILQQETANLPEDMQAEIDAYLNTYENDFEPVSFMSEQNEQIGFVQFVLKTQSIIHPEERTEEEHAEEKKGLWEMILRLFKRS